jgi:hypothetical protein
MGMTNLVDILRGFRACRDELVLVAPGHDDINTSLVEGRIGDEKLADSRVTSVLVRDDQFVSGSIASCRRAATIDWGTQYRRNEIGERLMLLDAPVLDNLVQELHTRLVAWSATQEGDPIPEGSVAPVMRELEGVAFDYDTFPGTKALALLSFVIEYETALPGES